MTDLLVIILALLGFATSALIFMRRKAKQPLKCWYDPHCNDIFESRFSRLLGIPNEELGMLYYASVIGLEAVSILAGPSGAAMAQPTLLGLTTIALIISITLLCIQIGVLKTICEYCVYGMLFSAFIWVVLRS